jgi:hypothetical protein
VKWTNPELQIRNPEISNWTFASRLFDSIFRDFGFAIQDSSNFTILLPSSMLPLWPGEAIVASFARTENLYPARRAIAAVFRIQDPVLAAESSSSSSNL